MGNQQVQQPPQPTAAPAPAAGPAHAPSTPNDQAADAATIERRRRAAAAVPADWKAALGGLQPPEVLPAMPEFRAATFALIVRNAGGLAETQAYLDAAHADAAYENALKELARNALPDRDAFAALRAAIESVTHAGDINQVSLRVLATLALLTEDGKCWLKHDTTIVAPLTKLIADHAAEWTKDDEGKARKAALDGIVNVIRNPHSAAPGAIVQITPAPLTPEQQKAADKLLADVKQMFPDGKGLPPNANAQQVAAQKADPKQMQQLLGLIAAAEPRVREWLYAWRDPQSHQGILQLLGNHLSPSQVEQVNASLDPVERLYKDLVDLRNGNRDPKAPKTTEYDLLYNFLAGHLGDEATRQRVRDHAPLMQQFFQFQGKEQQKVLLRMIVSGKIEPDAVDKLHDAAEHGDSNAAVTAIMELGATPAKLQGLRRDLVFVHRLQDKCNRRVNWSGVQVTPYDLFLKMCGVDANETREAGAVDKQAAINPNPPEPPLTPQERERLDRELYADSAQKLAKELNSWWTRDANVINNLRAFQQRAANTEIVAMLRRAHEAPGPELAKRTQAAGCDVRLKLQRGLDSDNLIEAERILGFAMDQAAVGVIGGAGTLATDNKPKDGEGKVPLEQALRETLVGGTVLSQLIHDHAQQIADELGRFFGARKEKVRGFWRDYHAKVSDDVCAQLRTKTGLARVWPIEMLANAFLQVGGGALSVKLASELGKDGNDVITEMGMQPTDIAARRTMAEDKKDQTQANEQAAHAQVEQAAQLEQFKAPASELFKGLALVSPYTTDDQLRGLGDKLKAGLAMQAVANVPPGVSAEPVKAPTAEHDVSAHPAAAAPTDFKSFYKKEYGIEPARHAVEVARALVTPKRPAAQIAPLLGVAAADLDVPLQAPNEDLAIDAAHHNITLVGPDFTVDEAKRRANEIWELLHANGQIQLIRAQLDGRTAEEQRLIHIGFRQKSGGIELAFYLQQHRAQQEAMDKSGGQGGEAIPFAVGGQGVAGDKRRLDVHGTVAETENMVEVAQTGKVSLERRITSDITSNNMDDVYAAIESASPDERRAILANDGLMSKLRAFGDDSYEWNRIHKSLTGQSDLFDRLESRAHGRHGFLGGFEGTDEKGMTTDIKAYIHQRKLAIQQEICGDAHPTEQQKQQIEQRLRDECQRLSENPSVRAILQDELSGVEKAQREGLIMNAGEDSKVASALTEGDWTEDEEKILDDIKHMSKEERKRCRDNPEYINQLHKAIQSQATWRDAMIALNSDEDGTKSDAEDNFAVLERASRSTRQDTTELMFEQDDVIFALSKLSPSEYQRLMADPRLQAQILTSLEGYPEQLALARQMMGFHAADEAGKLDIKVGDPPDPAKGVYSQQQVEKLAFLKFGSVNRLRAASTCGWQELLKAGIAIYNFKLRPGVDEEGAAPTGGDEKTAAAAAPPAPQPQPQVPAPGPQAAKAGPPPAQPQHQEPKPPAPPTQDPGDEIEKRLRAEIWIAVAAEVAPRIATWGVKDDMTPGTQQTVIEQAVKHERDPSNVLLTAATSWWSDDEETIKDTLRHASDELLINDWTTVTQTSPSGGQTLRDAYERWKAERTKAGAAPNPSATPPQPTAQGGQGAPGQPPPAPTAARRPPVGSEEWRAQVAFRSFAIDTSRRFEQKLLRYAGGLFTDNDATKDGERKVRDNNEWLEWRTIVRERIPSIDKEKIGAAIGAASDPEAMGMLRSDPLRATMENLTFDEERYAIDRGAGSNYNMDRVFAGGEGLALDNAMGDYRRTVLTSVIAKDGAKPGDEQYGDITGAEAGRIEDARARFNTSDSDFRSAKSQVASIAATVVALIITAVVTVLTAGTATGPLAVILLGAATAGASSLGANATREAIQGTDFDFSNEGLKNVARDTVLGAVTAGTTWYAGRLAGSLWNATSAAQQAAIVANVAKETTFVAELGKTMSEMSLQTGMQGVFESGMAAFDPAMWLEGWHEGWRRGGAAARKRAEEIPLEMVKAAVLAAITHSVTTGAGAAYKKLSGAKSPIDPQSTEEGLDITVEQRIEGQAEAKEEQHLQHAALGNRATYGQHAARVGKEMLGGLGTGIVQGGAEIALDERTYRAEGMKLTDMAGAVGSSALEMMKLAATNVHAHDAAAVQRFRAGARELALHASELSPHEQKLYSELAMQGHDSTVLSIAEFKQVRTEMIDKAVAEHEARSNTKLSAEQRTAFAKFCRDSSSFPEFEARVKGGPAKAPGEHVPPPPEAHFDTPVLREAELVRAREMAAKLGASIETAGANRQAVAELGPQRIALVNDAIRTLSQIGADAPEHAQIGELQSRINQASSELVNALQTATNGAVQLGALRGDLEAKIADATQAHFKPEKFQALHDALVAASAAHDTAPGSSDAAVPIAKQKLAELKGLVDDARALAEAAARHVGNHDVTAPRDPKQPEPPKDARHDKPHDDDVKAPRDGSTGQATGRRLHEPLSLAEPPATADAAAAKQLGAGFAGNSEPADPARTRRAIDAALEVQRPPGSVKVGDTLQIPRGGEHVPLEVKVEVATAPPGHDFAPVATVKLEGPDRAVIVVSPGASETAVERAVAGKLAELDHVARERAAGTRTDTTSALTEGSQSRELSPSDYNSIAQVKTALHQLEAAQARGDAQAAESIRHEAYSLIVGMGLLEAAPDKPIHPGPGGRPMHGEARVTGPEAAATRIELIDGVLGADKAKLHALVEAARANAPAIADVRTQRAAAREKLRAWCEKMIAERHAKNAALQGQVDAAIGADGTGVVFQRIIVGGGWGATADFATLGAHDGAAIPPVLAISHGSDPWAGRGDLLMGQNPAELEVRGFAVQPGDLAADPHEFTKSTDFATAVGASAAVSGMPTYDGSVTKVEQRPEGSAPGWPDGANYRITANGKSFYTHAVDIVSGPGPARVPPSGAKITDASGYAVDSHGGQFYKYMPGLKEPYHVVPAHEVPPEIRAKLDAERGRVSTTFVDHESGYSVDVSAHPEVYRDQAGNVVPDSTIPKDVAIRLGTHPESHMAHEGPKLVDSDGRAQSTRVFDPQSKCSVDATTHKVFGADGLEVDPKSLPAETRNRLGFTEEGKFRDPRFVAVDGGMSINPVTGHVIDTKSGAPVDVQQLEPARRAALEEEMKRRRVSFGGDLIAKDYAPGADGKTSNVLVFGAGPSGAWDVEQATQGGADIDWAGRLVLPKAEEFPKGSPAREKLEKLHDPKTPFEERQKLYVELRDVIVAESFKGGHNRRNSVPGLGAYSPEVLDEVDRGARSMVDMQPTTDGRYYVRFSDGSDGIYDKVVVSIGQDAAGPGGVGDLTRHVKGMQALRTGGGDIAGAQDESGNLRVLGAAGTSGAVASRLPKEERDEIGDQAQRLPSDSRGIAPSIRNNAGRIAGTNDGELAGSKLNAAEQAKLDELLATHDRAKAEQLFAEWRKEQQRSADPAQADDAVKAKQDPAKKPGIIPLMKPGERDVSVDSVSPEQREAARAKYATLIARLEAGESVVIPPGEASVEMMSAITLATGKEVALLRTPNGPRFLKLGDTSSVDLPEDTKIIAHTHPGGNLTLSDEDKAALADADQKSTVLIGAGGKAGRFRTGGDKDLSAEARGGKLKEPEKEIDFNDPKRFAKFIPNPDPLHKAISEDQRYDIIKDFPIKLITSAPGHKFLRSPQAMVAMAGEMKKAGTGNIFEGKEPIKLNVFTEGGEHPTVRSIEVEDGNHRLVAGLYAGKWNTIKDIPRGYLDIEVNGWDTQGQQHNRWIPLQIAQESKIPRDQWREVPKEWGPKGPSAEVSGGVSSLDKTIPEKFRGVTLDKVIEASLERLGLKPGDDPAKKKNF